MDLTRLEFIIYKCCLVQMVGMYVAEPRVMS